MTKQELAAYLVSLNSLLEAQEAAGTNLRSQVLVDEYNRNWDLLKSTIQKEHTNEARTS